MAATEPDNQRDDGYNVCGATKLQPYPGTTHSLCQNDDHTSLRLQVSGARLEKLDISRAKVVAAPLDKLIHGVCS